MANRTWYPVRTYGMATVGAPFQFTAGGTLAPVAPGGVLGGDVVASFAHVGGSNVITVTVKDPFNLLTWAKAEPRDDAAVGAFCTCGSFTNEGTSNQITFNINFFSFTAGGTLQPVNDPTSVVGVLLMARNTATPESYSK